MNLRTYFYNFFVTRTTFFSGWRGIFITLIFFVISKEIIGEVINHGFPLNRALFGFGVAGLFIYLYYRLWIEDQKNTNFLAFVLQNRDILRNGGTVYYEQSQITLLSKVVHFKGVFSFVIFTSSFPSRYLIPDKDPIAQFGLLYFLTSLLLGWWGLPWGPVKTAQALAIGIKGGKRQTIREILDEIEKMLKKSN